MPSPPHHNLEGPSGMHDLCTFCRVLASTAYDAAKIAPHLLTRCTQHVPHVVHESIPSRGVWRSCLLRALLRSVLHAACRHGRMWRQRAQRNALKRGALLHKDPQPLAVPNESQEAAADAASLLSDLPLLEHGVLISALLLNPTHELVRKQAVVLLKQLCLGTPHMTVKLGMRLAKLLPEASVAGKSLASSILLLALKIFNGTAILGWIADIQQAASGMIQAILFWLQAQPAAMQECNMQCCSGLVEVVIEAEQTLTCHFVSLHATLSYM